MRRKENASERSRNPANSKSRLWEPCTPSAICRTSMPLNANQNTPGVCVCVRVSEAAWWYLVAFKISISTAHSHKICFLTYRRQSNSPMYVPTSNARLSACSSVRTKSKNSKIWNSEICSLFFLCAFCVLLCSFYSEEVLRNTSAGSEFSCCPLFFCPARNQWFLFFQTFPKNKLRVLYIWLMYICKNVQETNRRCAFSSNLDWTQVI